MGTTRRLHEHHRKIHCVAAEPAEALHGLEGLKHIKPATSFRSGYAYDNILYTVAGALIEAVSGQSYESYVREHVYKPAGLKTATSDEPSRLGTANRAYPHGRINGPVRGLGPLSLLDETDQLGAASTPAGHRYCVFSEMYLAW